MQRYFTSANLNENEPFEMENGDTHHMINVMRFRIGDAFEIVDMNERVFLCKIVNISDNTVEYIVIEEQLNSSEMPINISVFCPLLKGEKFEWMLQKSTELGARNFIIYEAERSIVKLDHNKKDKRLGRFKKIIKEASGQSKRSIIPEIHFGDKLNDIDFSNYDDIIIAYEGNVHNDSLSLRQLSEFQKNQKIAFIFGPEGGLTADEIKFDEAAQSVRLGPRILRAESAPLYFLSSMSYIYE